MDTIRLCNECAAPLAADAPEGLCPKCLLKAGLGSEPGGSGPKGNTGSPPAPSIHDLAPLFPQLKLLGLVGQGGMGMVYKALQTQLDRLVALKILSPELSRDPAFAERFSREARALAQLNHPNIVAIYDFGKAGGFYYFVMEFVDGMNLGQMEQIKKQLAPEQALAMVPRICDALQYAHDEGIVHRDIKPGNILIDKKGRVKIADFGLAKITGQEQADATLTNTGMTMGTPRYMAPEQLQNAKGVDHRADIYSLGVVFYEMLTGELPVGRFPPPSQMVQVDVRLDEVVLRSLERDVLRRYQHASEVKTDLEHIANADVAPAVSEGTLSQPTPEAGAESGKVHRRIKRAANGLAVAGAVYLLTLPAILLAVVSTGRFDLGGQGGSLTSFVILFSLPYGFVCFTALRMRRLQSRRLALAGSILLGALTLGNFLGLVIGDAPGVTILAPGIWLRRWLGIWLTPGDLLGLPAAIWAWVVLRQPDVRATFERAKTQLAQSGRLAAKVPARRLLITALSLCVVLAGVIILSPPAEMPFYTFGGQTLFVAGAEGPRLARRFIRKMDLKPLQVEALNRVFQNYYREFVSLEQRHMAFNKDAQGHLRIKISPFQEETAVLAKRMLADAQGIIGFDVFQPNDPDNWVSFGLFRHAGATTVTAELWKDKAVYFFKEDQEPYIHAGRQYGGKSRSAHDPDFKKGFPPEYWIYWTHLGPRP